MKKVVRLAASDADKIERAAALIGLSFQAFAASTLLYIADVILAGIPAGTFLLGSNSNESEDKHDK